MFIALIDNEIRQTIATTALLKGEIIFIHFWKKKQMNITFARFFCEKKKILFGVHEIICYLCIDNVCIATLPLQEPSCVTVEKQFSTAPLSNEATTTTTTPAAKERSVDEKSVAHTLTSMMPPALHATATPTIFRATLSVSATGDTSDSTTTLSHAVKPLSPARVASLFATSPHGPRRCATLTPDVSPHYRAVRLQHTNTL